jgi:hypothetical protein
VKTYWWISKIYDRHFRPKQFNKVPKNVSTHSRFIVIWISRPRIDVPLRSHNARPDYPEKLDWNLEKGIVVQTWRFFQKPGGLKKKYLYKFISHPYQVCFSEPKSIENKSKPSVRQFTFFLFKTILDNYFYLWLIVSNCLLLLAFSWKAIHTTTSVPFFIFLPSDYSCPEKGKMRRKTCLHSQIFVPWFQKMDSLDAVIFNMAWQAVKVACITSLYVPFPFTIPAFLFSEILANQEADSGTIIRLTKASFWNFKARLHYPENLDSKRTKIWEKSKRYHSNIQSTDSSLYKKKESAAFTRKNPEEKQTPFSWIWIFRIQLSWY